MKLLDLFCGAGGAAMGYHRAGFDEIVGVDIKPMPRYPFTFIQADALEYVAAHGHEFDAIHASPPCQAYSIMRNLPWLRHKEYERLIEPTRELLEEIAVPWVIENVMGAKLAAERLCGQMFGLPFLRHRLFLSSFYWLAPMHPPHGGVIRRGRGLGSRARDIITLENGKQVERRGLPGHGVTVIPSMTGGLGHAASFAFAKSAIGCTWMKREELTQAIPPAYTEFIGRQLIALLNR